MNKILVINVNWVGDVVFSSPVFRALRDKYPDAQIVCMAVPRVRAICECISEIDSIIEYDEKGKHWSPVGKIKIIRQLRREKFDAAFILHGSKTRALLTHWAKIPIRVGYDTKGRSKYLTNAVKVPDKNLHRSDYYLGVLEAAGIEVNNRETTLHVNDDDQKYMENLLRTHSITQNNSFVVINPGGNWDLKQWPKENFTQLISELMKQGKQVVISGASKDDALVEAIIKPLKIKPIVLTGKTTLKQVVALMKYADIVVSADSGPLHLANSVGTDVIALFGPTRPEITGPRGSGKITIIQHDVGCNRKACYYLECPDNICMKAITVRDVLDRA